jgi:methylated-DNA-[protein]-cysteine S-methyltransferase
MSEKKSLSALGKGQMAVFPSEFGWMAAAWIDGRLSQLAFGHRDADQAAAALRLEPEMSANMDRRDDPLVSRLQAFARGEADDFRDVTIDERGLSDFQRRVVRCCRRIARGKTLTYGELAAQVGAPGAARAVGNVMATNRLPLIVPCHRVVAAGGSLGGYSAPGGLTVKRRLLAMEQATTGVAATHRRSRG